MSKPIDSQVRLLKSSLINPLLSDWMETREVFDSPPNEARVATVTAGNQFVLIDSSMQAGKIAIGATSAVDETTGWYYAAQLGGAIGTADVAMDTDGYGEALNCCTVRVAGTHRPIQVNGFEVFGLMQAASTVADGDAIGAAAAENLQISFAYIAADGTVTLTAVDAAAAVDVEFSMPVARRRANVLPIEKVGGSKDAPYLSVPSVAPVISTQIVDVDTNFALAEVITLATGDGAGTGTGTPNATGQGAEAITTLGATAAEFNENDNLQVYRNGVLQEKGVDVIWDSATTFHFNDVLIAGESWMIKEAVYA